MRDTSMPRKHGQQVEKLQVTATEFKRTAGQFIEAAAKRPVFITKHGRPARVLVDAEEYERLKRLDTRRALLVEDLTDEEIKLFERADLGPRDKHLDHLLK